MGSNLFFSLEHLEKFKSNIFIRECKSEQSTTSYTYDRIASEVKSCLRKFEQFELDHNGSIAINMIEHSAGSCVLLLGILNHGCSFHCFDFLSEKDIFNRLVRCRVRYIITKDNFDFQKLCGHLHGTFKIFDDEFLLVEVGVYPEQFFCDKSTFCYTITTSGSTGVPKVVHVPYMCIEKNIVSLCSTLNIKESDVIFLSSPATFDPFVVEFFIAIRQGATLFITSPILRLTGNYRVLKTVSIWQTTPSLFRQLGIDVIKGLFMQPYTALRCLLLGGETFPTHGEIQSWLPENFISGSKRIFNIYGITEVSCWSTLYEFDPDKLFDNNRIPLGNSLDDTTILNIKSETDGTVITEMCCRGELLIGSSVRRCFIPASDLHYRIENVNDVIFRQTGDIVQRDKMGNIFYIGRKNNCIKRLGKLLCLDSLADKIYTILKYFVVCLWHSECNKLILCINHNRDQKPDKEKDRLKLNKHLSDFEQLDAVFYVDTLPLNNHGKVDRFKLLQNVLQHEKENNKNPLELFKNFLISVIGFPEDILHVKTQCNNKRQKLDLNISFTETGGTSFQALSLATEIGKKLHNSQDQRKFLEILLSPDKTIANIFEFLENAPYEFEKCKENQTTTLPINILYPKKMSIKVAWRSYLKKCVDASPCIFKGNFVSVGSHSKLLLTLNAISGTEISRMELTDRIECPVVFVSHDLAVVGCYDGTLYGFDFNLGSIKWKLYINGMIKARPIIVRNILIVSSYADDFNIKAYDIEAMNCVWRSKLGTKGIYASPLKISENFMLFCTLDGTHALMQTASGKIIWMNKLDSPIFSSPAIISEESDEVAIAEVKGQIHICKVSDGDVVATFQADGNIFSSLKIYEKGSENKLVIFGCHDANVYCLNYRPKTKQLNILWRFLLNAAVYSTPTILFEDTIVACSTKGLIVLINLFTSEIQAVFDAKCEIFSSPCVFNNKYIYVGARNNYLYAFNIEK